MDQTPLQTTQAYGIPPTAVRNNEAINDQERVLSAGIGTILVLLGVRRGRLTGFLAALTGSALIARGAIGHVPIPRPLKSNPIEKQVAETFNWESAATVSRSVTIRKPVDEIYRAWQGLENRPRFMQNIESVRDLGGGRSHWVAKGLFGKRVEWESETTQNVPNERVSWKSVEGSDYNTSGTVTFRPAPGNRGTEVTLMLSYEPPAGQLGRAVASLFNQSPTQLARQDLISFKQMMETGEITTSAIRKEQQQATA